mmetsp:Transcript_1817/g.3939  ORF Transcript_1817/g.3939 Transcript_1817/m.3939 type:complete len:269 (-) Transcript_1817:329-1135(-)
MAASLSRSMVETSIISAVCGRSSCGRSCTMGLSSTLNATACGPPTSISSFVISSRCIFCMHTTHHVPLLVGTKDTSARIIGGWRRPRFARRSTAMGRGRGRGHSIVRGTIMGRKKLSSRKMLSNVGKKELSRPPTDDEDSRQELAVAPFSHLHSVLNPDSVAMHSFTTARELAHVVTSHVCLASSQAAVSASTSASAAAASASSASASCACASASASSWASVSACTALSNRLLKLSSSSFCCSGVSVWSSRADPWNAPVSSRGTIICS